MYRSVSISNPCSDNDTDVDDVDDVDGADDDDDGDDDVTCSSSLNVNPNVRVKSADVEDTFVSSPIACGIVPVMGNDISYVKVGILSITSNTIRSRFFGFVVAVAVALAVAVAEPEEISSSLT